MAVRPPAVQSRHHDCARLLRIDCNAAETEIQVATGDRSDVSQGARSDVVLPNRAIRAVIRTGTV